MNYSIPSVVAVAIWGGLAALVATYTAKAYIKTAKGLPDFSPGTGGGGDFAPGELS